MDKRDDFERDAVRGLRRPAKVKKAGKRARRSANPAVKCFRGRRLRGGGSASVPDEGERALAKEKVQDPTASINVKGKFMNSSHREGSQLSPRVAIKWPREKTGGGVVRQHPTTAGEKFIK